MLRTANLLVLASILIVACLNSFARSAEQPRADVGSPTFKKTRLDGQFRSEGVAVGDFNRDGKVDIAAGSVWYAAPNWKMHTIHAEAKVFEPKKYSNCFNCFADDLNGDGWTDVIQVTWPGKEAVWFENPKSAAGEWKRHVIVAIASNESPQFVDIDNDGTRDLVLATSPDQPDSPNRRMAIARRTDKAEATWKIEQVSVKGAPGTRRYEHGLGVGDINGDGRNDIVVPAGWWESPAKSASGEPWKFHAVKLGDAAADMHVYDFDGDGDSDVLSSSAHAYGIWWHEQLPDAKWKTHLIDDSLSQTHGLCMADINGDGLPDFVTGKRWWAHGGRDPGGNDPALFFWYEFTRVDGKPTWTPHQFDHDSGPGTQFQVADVNGDGLFDIVSSNKKGVHLFEQVRK